MLPPVGDLYLSPPCLLIYHLLPYALPCTHFLSSNLISLFKVVSSHSLFAYSLSKSLANKKSLHYLARLDPSSTTTQASPCLNIYVSPTKPSMLPLSCIVITLSQNYILLPLWEQISFFSNWRKAPASVG